MSAHIFAETISQKQVNKPLHNKEIEGGGYGFTMSFACKQRSYQVNVYLYTHISHHVSWWFTILDRTSACEDASGCRHQSIFDLTHPPNRWMKCGVIRWIPDDGRWSGRQKGGLRKAVERDKRQGLEMAQVCLERRAADRKWWRSPGGLVRVPLHV